MNTAADIEQLVAHFQPGDTVFIPGSAGEPSELTEMLVNNPDLAPGVTFITSFLSPTTSLVKSLNTNPM